MPTHNISGAAAAVADELLLLPVPLSLLLLVTCDGKRMGKLPTTNTRHKRTGIKPPKDSTIKGKRNQNVEVGVWRGAMLTQVHSTTANSVRTTATAHRCATTVTPGCGDASPLRMSTPFPSTANHRYSTVKKSTVRGGEVQVHSPVSRAFISYSTFVYAALGSKL